MVFHNNNFPPPTCRPDSDGTRFNRSTKICTMHYRLTSLRERYTNDRSYRYIHSCRTINLSNTHRAPLNLSASCFNLFFWWKKWHRSANRQMDMPRRFKQIYIHYTYFCRLIFQTNGTDICGENKIVFLHKLHLLVWRLATVGVRPMDGIGHHFHSLFITITYKLCVEAHALSFA